MASATHWNPRAASRTHSCFASPKHTGAASARVVSRPACSIPPLSCSAVKRGAWWKTAPGIWTCTRPSVSASWLCRPNGGRCIFATTPPFPETSSERSTRSPGCSAFASARHALRTTLRQTQRCSSPHLRWSPPPEERNCPIPGFGPFRKMTQVARASSLPPLIYK